MPFAAPLALLGLVFVPLVVAFWMLKLRRTERTVGSTLLWQRFGEDLQANAPWQRLRRSFLLLLQLLLVVLLALLAAQPFTERPATLARDLVVVVDASASMAATDEAPSRLEAAKGRVLDALRDLPAGGRVSVVVAGTTPRVVVNATADLGRVRAALAAISATPATADMGEALALASALAARAGDAQVLVATDAAYAPPEGVAGGGARHGPPGGPRAEEPGDRGLRRAELADGGDALGLHLGRQHGPRAVHRAGGALGRWPAPGGARPVPRPGQPGRRGDRRRAARRPRSRGPPRGRRPARPRRPGMGGRAARPPPADPPGERRRPVPRDCPQLPAQRRALRRPAGRLRRRHEARAVRPRHLRRRPPGDPAAGPDAGDRPAAHEPAGDRDRHARRSGPGPAGARRAAPPLRGPHDPPRGPGDAALAALLGADRHPHGGRRSSPVHRRAGRRGDGGPRLRAAALGPSPPGGLPDPGQQPGRRARGRLARADDGPGTGHAREPPDPVRSQRRAGHAARRDDARPRPERDRGRDGDLRLHRAARGLHGRAARARGPRSRAGRVARRLGAQRLAHRRPHHDARRLALAVPPRRRPVGPGPVRGRPLRRERVDDRAGLRRRAGALGSATAGGRGGDADGRPPARNDLWVPLAALALAFLVLEAFVFQRDALVRIRRRLGLGADGRPGRGPGRRPSAGPA